MLRDSVDCEVVSAFEPRETLVGEQRTNAFQAESFARSLQNLEAPRQATSFADTVRTSRAPRARRACSS